ncbi:MAG: DUF1846 domain-containing protein [Clostridiales bacterium]|nr:DUF1846 domain-containing protein [Clostridiales bacterium]
MHKIGFDNAKYLELQTQHIRERISKFGGKLYLEFGGKLFDDYHASRVLPGFEPDSKLKMLLQMREQAEILLVVSADDIEHSKKRGDLGITYDADALRLIDAARAAGLAANSVVITHYRAQHAADAFQNKLKSLGVKVYRHYPIEGYPSNLPLIVSEDGFGKNDYIETEKPLVIVTAPGPGSGKMAVCLSQLYHEHMRGIAAGYAKFETFPVWNLPQQHPVNLAYEAATLDLYDKNVIDPYHLQAYNKVAVNYNRDIEVFPVLKAIFEAIYGESPYCSPTDMGVNMAGFCLSDDEACQEAARMEIVRRYYAARCALRMGVGSEAEVSNAEILMKRAQVAPDARPVVAPALALAEKTGAPAAALELNDGRIVTGKTSDLLGPAAALLLNALKAIAGINKEIDLISATIIEPIQDLKVNHLGNRNPRLHTDEILVALSICAATNPTAELAMQAIEHLRGCQAHSSVILSGVDEGVFRKLGINLTCEPQYQSKQLYHK